MADLRSSVMVLEDSSTQAGLPLHKALAGDASAAKNAHGALTFTDAAGNFQYGKVNANREVVVSLESADLANLSDNGLVAGNAAFQDVVTIPLTPDAVYRKIGIVAGCTRDAVFQLVHLDDATPVVLAQGFIVGAGSMSIAEVLETLEFTAGSTGTQDLILQGKNLNAVSDLRGTLTAQEVQ